MEISTARRNRKKENKTIIYLKENSIFAISFQSKRLYNITLVSGKKLRVIKKASFDDTLITWPNQLLCPLKETV